MVLDVMLELLSGRSCQDSVYGCERGKEWSGDIVQSWSVFDKRQSHYRSAGEDEGSS